MSLTLLKSKFVRKLTFAIMILSLQSSAHGDDKTKLSVQTRLNKLESEVVNATSSLAFLLKEYQKPEVLKPPRNIKQRVADAEILFLLKQYQETSLVFTELVNEVRRKLPEQYGKVLYYLGESNFQIRNYSSSRIYFTDLLALGELEHAVESLRRLIQISDKTGDYAQLNDNVLLIKEIIKGPLPAEIAYIYAKSLLRRGKAYEALNILQDIPMDTLDAVKGEYMKAVSYTALNDKEKAIASFNNVLEWSTKWQADIHLSKKDKDQLIIIWEMAKINIGRIFYEKGDFAQSLHAYQEISRNSAVFNRMLFEVTWGYVREGERTKDPVKKKRFFNQALNTLDLLLVEEKGNTLAPEARLLEGNLKLRMGQYADALESFDRIFGQYQQVLNNLSSVTSAFDTPREYFKQILSTRKQGELGWKNVMPAEAIRWAKQDPAMGSALDMLQDIDQSKNWIVDGRDLVDKLLEALEGDKRINFFPTLQDAQAKLVEMSNTFILLAERLAELNADIVLEQSDETLKEQIIQARDDRLKLEPVYKALPKTKEEYAGRRDKISAAMMQTQQEAYRLKYDIGAIRSQLVALEKWINDHLQDIDIPAQEVRDLRERIAFERRSIAELENVQSMLEKEVERQRSLMKLVTTEEQRDQEIRMRYSAAVQREVELLAKANKGITGAKAELLKKIKQLREKAEQGQTRLQNVMAKMTDSLESQSKDLRVQVLAQRAIFDTYENDLEKLETESEDFISDLSILSFNKVKQRFKKLILRADVGLVDVAWTKKEGLTKGITKDVKLRNRQLEVLRREFREIAQEQGDE